MAILPYQCSCRPALQQSVEAARCGRCATLLVTCALHARNLFDWHIGAIDLDQIMSRLLRISGNVGVLPERIARIDFRNRRGTFPTGEIHKWTAASILLSLSHSRTCRSGCARGSQRTRHLIQIKGRQGARCYKRPVVHQGLYEKNVTSPGRISAVTERCLPVG